MEEQSQVKMYDETPVSAPSNFIVEADARLLAGVILWGAAIGLLVMGLGFLLRQFFIEPILCRSLDAFSLCASGGALAMNSATVIMAVAGTIGLLRLSVYRPLLIALAAAISLWGAQSWLGALSWYEMTFWLVLLYAIAYGTYAWILRIYNFPLALVLTVALVIAARVVLQW